MAEWMLLLLFGGALVVGVLRKLNKVRVIHVEFDEEPSHVPAQVKTNKRKQLKN